MAKPETRVIREKLNTSNYGEHSSPIFMTSSFVFEDVDEMHDAFTGKKERNIYSRFSNPNIDELIHKVCVLEGAETGIATGTGMASVFSSMASFLESGDHILASKTLFGSTYRILEEIFPKWGVEYSYAEPTDLNDWKEKIQPNTKLVYLETPSNPLLTLVDIKAVAALAKSNNAILIIDNCFATPILQRPLELGADLIVHSATKFMDGQGRSLGGLVVGREELIEKVRFFTRFTGPAISPFNAWVISKSLETLSLRMEKHCSNALAIAKFLEAHPKVDKVIYPFLESFPQYELAKSQMDQGGGLISFELKGNLESTKAMIDNSTLFSNTSNLGDSRSILTHPSSSALAKKTKEEREAVGVKDTLIRLSVGLENVEDLIEDLNASLKLIEVG